MYVRVCMYLYVCNVYVCMYCCGDTQWAEPRVLLPVSHDVLLFHSSCTAFILCGGGTQWAEPRVFIPVSLDVLLRCQFTADRHQVAPRSTEGTLTRFGTLVLAPFSCQSCSGTLVLAPFSWQPCFGTLVLAPLFWQPFFGNLVLESNVPHVPSAALNPQPRKPPQNKEKRRWR